LILDCSVTSCWCFEDETRAYADAVFAALDEYLAKVPPLWAIETANVLLVAERKKRIVPTDTAKFWALLARLPLTVDSDLSLAVARDVTALGRTHQLSAYDASYLELALREGGVLATQDEALKKACRRAGVGLFVA